MAIALGLFLGFFLFGPAVCWLAGLMNPIGYIGVLPWNVPNCTCSGPPRNFNHDGQCPRGQDLRARS